MWIITLKIQNDLFFLSQKKTFLKIGMKNGASYQTTTLKKNLRAETWYKEKKPLFLFCLKCFYFMNIESYKFMFSLYNNLPNRHNVDIYLKANGALYCLNMFLNLWTYWSINSMPVDVSSSTNYSVRTFWTVHWVRISIIALTIATDLPWDFADLRCWTHNAFVWIPNTWKI